MQHTEKLSFARPSRRAARALTAILAFAIAAGAGCINRPMKRAWPGGPVVETQVLPQNINRDLDLLFVIDNSQSMADEQQNLRANFPSLLDGLRNLSGGLPNLHIGITTTDVGVAPWSIPGCDSPEDGRLVRRAQCTNPLSGNMIVDVAPRGCAVERDAGVCSSHACVQAHCDAAEPGGGTTLVIDSDGCPRCRNYSGETLEQVFSCQAEVGVEGCGFEQPLEAMKRAIDGRNPGFLREGALLAVVFITDEDDCSAATPEIFNTDPAMSTAESTLGHLSSFRCFEFGVTCDVDGRSPGVRQNCRPREADDPRALLQSIDHYRDALVAPGGPKLPEEVIVAAITGPVAGDSVTVGPSAAFPDMAELQFSCPSAAAPEGAVPAIRLRSFVSSFSPEAADLDWAFTSICAESFQPALAGIADRIVDRLDQCLHVPPLGCTDPGAEVGKAWDAQSCNDTCHAECRVRDYDRTVGPAAAVEVPRCVAVCPAGLCPDNLDPTQAYAGGHPLAEDPNLPVPACWQIVYNPECTLGNGAEVLISRRQAAPPRTVSEVICRGVSPREQLCDDGRDNDGDCLIDNDDPDCLPH